MVGQEKILFIIKTVQGGLTLWYLNFLVDSERKKYVMVVLNQFVLNI